MTLPGRQCGSCTVCCEQVSIKELDSPARVPCRFQKEDPRGSCSIFGSPERPSVCSGFLCSWRHGVGPEGARPDKTGVLLSINRTPSGPFGFALEFRPNAVLCEAREVIVEWVRSIALPLIVSAYETPPPRDTGDSVAIHDSLMPRCSRIAGKEITRLSHDVGLYALIKEVS